MSDRDTPFHQPSSALYHVTAKKPKLFPQEDSETIEPSFQFFSLSEI